MHGRVKIGRENAVNVHTSQDRWAIHTIVSQDEPKLAKIQQFLVVGEALNDSGKKAKLENKIKELPSPYSKHAFRVPFDAATDTTAGTATRNSHRELSNAIRSIRRGDSCPSTTLDLTHSSPCSTTHMDDPQAILRTRVCFKTKRFIVITTKLVTHHLAGVRAAWARIVDFSLHRWWLNRRGALEYVYPTSTLCTAIRGGPSQGALELGAVVSACPPLRPARCHIHHPGPSVLRTDLSMFSGTV